MSDPRKLHPLGLASLVLVDGQTGSGLPNILEAYGYEQDSGDPYLWRLAEDKDCGIFFSDDYTVAVMLGSNIEHAENIGYALSKAGWTKAELSAIDRDAEENLLKAVSTIELTDVHSLYKDGGSGHAFGTDQHRSGQYGDELPLSFDAQPARDAPSVGTVAAETADELATAMTELEAALGRNQQLEDDNRRLSNRIADLEQQMQHRPPVNASASDPGLARIVEMLLQNQVEQALSTNSLFHTIKDAGYAVRLQLIQHRA